MQRAPRKKAPNPYIDDEAAESPIEKAKKPKKKLTLTDEQHLILDNLAERLPGWQRNCIPPELSAVDFPGFTAKQLVARIKQHFQLKHLNLCTSFLSLPVCSYVL